MVPEKVGDQPQNLALKKSNAFGLYDMRGNVWEWVWDWYGKHSSEAQADPIGPTRGVHRLIRGGCCYFIVMGVRVSDRADATPNMIYDALGFRLARLP